MEAPFRVLRYLLYFAVASSVAGYVTFKVMGSRIDVEVPDVTGMEVSKAGETLEAHGLVLVVESEAHDIGVPEGRIISQDISPGTIVKGEAQVPVVLSKGPEVRLIPSVVGMEMEKAMVLFEKERLPVERVIKVRSDTVREGGVIAQSPLPEEKTGGGMTVIVSAGAYDVSYYCPFFVGMRKEDALSLAAELALSVELRGSTEAVAVMEQSPEPGADIKAGDVVKLTLGG